MAKKKPNILAKILLAFFVIIVALILIGVVFSGCESDDYDTDATASSDPFRDKPAGKEPPFEPIAASFTSDDPRIKMIEVNQSLSYGFDTDTGEFYLIENFAAGKETAVFVSLTEPFSMSGEASLTIEKDDRIVTTLLPADMPDAKTLLFQPKNLADVEHWGPGRYTFTFELDGSKAVRTTNFFETIPMKVLAVPIRAYYAGRVIDCYGDWRNGVQMITAQYPLAKADVEYILAPELDLSDRRYDLCDEDGQYNVWKALRDLQTPGNDYTMIVGFIREPAGDGDVLGYTYGMPANIVVESEPDMLATVVHEIAHCYNIGDEYEGGSLNCALNSPPYGMEGYDIITGKKAVGTKKTVIGGYEYGINGSGSVIYPDQRAYWVEGRTALGTVSSYMGAGTGADSFTLWTTSEIWNQLFRAFTGFSSVGAAGAPGGGSSSGGTYGGGDDGAYGGGDDGSYGGGDGGGYGYIDGDYWGQCPSCYSDVYDPDFYVPCRSCCEYTLITGNYTSCDWCGTSLDINSYYDEDLYIECACCEYLIWWEDFNDFNGGLNKTSKTSKPVIAIEISGVLEKDGSFEAYPWYVYEAEPSEITMNRNGAYTVNFYDKGGKRLSTSNFDINSTAQITTKAKTTFVQNVRIPVNVVVRFPEGAAQIVIQKGDQAIYTRDVSANAPVVSFKGLTDYQKLENKTTVSWEASDADGDDIYFELWYCPNEDEYFNIAADIKETSIEVDLSKYPGTDEGYFYLFATDGVRTTEADSPWIKIPYKAPEIISGQQGIPETKITEEICFDVDIYDPQDGWLWDEEVVWTLDGKEFLTGSFLWVWPYELPPGTHVFTCTATNSAGMSASKDFTFTILDDESDLPDDWSREDVAYALASGFVLPLNRIDAPVTRGQFAVLMDNLYGMVLDIDEPYPDYEENVVTDCGQDDYEQFLMVHLGVMEAPGGIFAPHKPLTEREAMLIMNRIVALADPDMADADAGEAEILEDWLDDGIVDEAGPGVYEASEKLSNKLALVRLARLIDAIF